MTGIRAQLPLPVLPAGRHALVWVQGFWRGWHSSFNQWLVRYLYIPLGGSRRRAAAIWPTFFFVAVWHDLEVG